jgi:hypothetical protein
MTMSKAATTEDRSLIRDVFGKKQFDDRIDNKPDIGTAEALSIIGRCIGMLFEVRGLFCAKFLLRLGLIFPGLLLPWIAKIVIDNAVLQRPIGGTEVDRRQGSGWYHVDRDYHLFRHADNRWRASQRDRCGFITGTGGRLAVRKHHQRRFQCRKRLVGDCRIYGGGPHDTDYI